MQEGQLRPRGRPPSDDPARNLTVRFSNADIARIEDGAAMTGESLSAFIRASALARVDQLEFDALR